MDASPNSWSDGEAPPDRFWDGKDTVLLFAKPKGREERVRELLTAEFGAA